jgi:predicted ATP-dependent serine protease
MIPHAAGPLLAKTGAKTNQALSRTAERKRFPFFTDVSIADLADPEWIVEGLLPAEALVEMHGQPGSKKSFLALSLSMAIATGQDWFGRPVRKGSVVYIAAEGANGYKSRVASWKDAAEFEGLAGVHFLTDAVPLLNPKDVALFIDQIRERHLKPTLIVVDTLSRCFEGGRENDAEDMGRLVGTLDRIRREFDATVLLVHHTRKDGGAERGSSALRGAADAMFSVRSDTENTMAMSCAKMKDGPAFKPLKFELVKNGSSCVLVQTESTSNLNAEAVSVDRTLLSKLSDGALSYTEWLGLSELKDSTFKRRRTALLEQHLVEEESNRYALTKTGREIVTPTNPLTSAGSTGSRSYELDRMDPSLLPVRNWGARREPAAA